MLPSPSGRAGIVLPRRLAKGDTIAVVSPSWGGLGRLVERTARAVAALERRGYRVRVMPHANGVSDGGRSWVAASREERLEDLHGAFADPSVRAVLVAMGGNHAAELLERLDFNLIGANPKIVCGYSDASTLLVAIHDRCSLVTFFGPTLVPEFGEFEGPDEDVVRSFERAVGLAEPYGRFGPVAWQAVGSRAAADVAGRQRRREPGERRAVLREAPGEATGLSVAATLPALCSLLGTPWQPSTAGRVLVLETPGRPYNPQWADADLAHLRNAGLLDDLAALVLGRVDGWSLAERRQFHESALDATRGWSYPVLAGVEASHCAPMLTLPIGVALSLEGEHLRVDGAAVTD